MQPPWEPFLLFALCGVGLFSIGFLGLLVCAHVLRKILALNVMGGGVFLFFISIARRNTHDFPDPVPHAMVLTGIVVAFGVTAFAVTLARRLYSTTRRTTLGRSDGEDAS